MPLVLFDVMFAGLVPEDVAGGVRAARALTVLVLDPEVDAFPGATLAEIDERGIHPLATFPVGVQVYIEGLPEETFDFDDERARIWWRGLLVGHMVRGCRT